MTLDYRTQVPVMQNDQEPLSDQMKDPHDTVTGDDIAVYVFDGIKRTVAMHPDEAVFALSIGVTAFGIVESILYGRKVFAH